MFCIPKQTSIGAASAFERSTGRAPAPVQIDGPALTGNAAGQAVSGKQQTQS
jgi:hypothetical protein